MYLRKQMKFIKIFYKFKNIFFYRFKKTSTGIVGNVNNLNEIKDFVFNFSDSENTHLGDILFLLPAIISIQKKYNVKVIASNSIISALEYFGYQHNNYIRDDFIEISYVWSRKKSKNFYIYLNLTDRNIKKKPSELLIDYLNKKNFDIHLIDDLNMNKSGDDKYFVYNNECESGKFRLLRSIRKKLDNKALQLINENKVAIVVGINRNNKIPFVSNYIDMRERTTIIELIQIINSVNIIISYDNAISHLGIILNKNNVYISMRYFSRKYSKYLQSYIFPLCQSKSVIVYL